MKNQALKLISYDHWANARIITAMSQVENLPPQMTVSDCINHVVEHGSYHRGQIVALLKGLLPELPATDFVLFARSESR